MREWPDVNILRKTKLIALLKKNKKFEWTSNQQQSFETLKKRFTEEPVLMIPDHLKPFQIEVDASKYATGVILTQLDSNGD